MNLNKVYKHFDVITEAENRNDNKVYYSLNISVDKGRFKAKGDGKFTLSEEESRGILSIEDIINAIVQKEVEKGSHIVNHDGVNSKDILSQMLFAFMDKENAKYLSATDEIQFSFDYGPSDNNCIGILVSKPLGSPSFSMVMRLNSKALPNEFNKQAVDMQILSYSSKNNTN